MATKLTDAELKAQYEQEMALLDEYNKSVSSPEAPVKKEEPGFLETAINVADIPGSVVRTGIEAAISPKKEILPEISKQIQNIAKEPLTGSTMGSRGEDINREILGRFGEEYKKESLPGKIAGLTTELAVETATSPFNLISAIPKVSKVIRKPLMSASEKQAAKTVAKYTTKAATTAEGVDPKVIGAFLVESDLQGHMRNPVKFYEKIAGKTPVLKINPESLETLVIKKGKRQGGLIGKTSEEITSLLNTIQKEYGIESINTADIGVANLMKNIQKKLSLTSGETPDMSKIEQVLVDTLKPFKKTKVQGTAKEEIAKIPGSLELGKVVTPGEMELKLSPNKVTLTQLHELRKNIGKLLSDRDFYKTPDKAMALESEVLRDLYREIGDEIKKTLAGKEIRVGNTLVDAKEFYEGQNSKLKNLYDLESMLEFTPLNELKQSDIPAVLTGMAAKGGVLGATAGLAGLMGLPNYAGTAALIGGTLGAGMSAANKLEQATPEYLTSIFKQAAKVAPKVIPPLVPQGTIMYMRGGKQVPPPEQSPIPFPSSSRINFTPKDIINFKIPNNSQEILQNKEKVLAKLTQSGNAEEAGVMAQILNSRPKDVSAVMSQLMMSTPELFDIDEYKVFDGKFVDPADMDRAIAKTSVREDMDSIKKAKLINKLAKHQMWDPGLA
jgi:hypothetical protein